MDSLSEGRDEDAHARQQHGRAAGQRTTCTRCNSTDTCCWQSCRGSIADETPCMLSEMVPASAGTAAADAGTPSNSHAAPPGPDTAYTINVGGTLFTTTLATLTAVPGSYLDTLFSGSRWAPSVHVQGTNTPLIDRSPECFKHVLAFLRCLRYHDSQPTLPDLTGCSSQSCSLRQLRAEAEFYGLSGLARLCDLGPRFCTADICFTEQQQAGGSSSSSSHSAADDQQQQQQQQQEDNILPARGLRQQDSGVGGIGRSDSPVAPVSGEDIQVTVQQHQEPGAQDQHHLQQPLLPLQQHQQQPHGPSLLAQAVAAAQQMQATLQATWGSSSQLQQLADLVLQHLLHMPLSAQQPDLVTALANPGSGNRLELLLQYYPVGDLRIELECRTVPAGAAPAAAAAAAAGAAAAGPGVGVGVAGSSPMPSPRDGWSQPQQQQQQQQQQQLLQPGVSHASPAAALAAAAAASSPAASAAAAAAARASSADSTCSTSSSSGTITLPGPGWGGVTAYFTFRIRETANTYVLIQQMPGDGQQQQEVSRAAYKAEVVRYSTLHKLLVQQAPRSSVAGLMFLLEGAGFAAVKLSTVLDTYYVGGNAFPGVKSVLTFDI